MKTTTYCQLKISLYILTGWVTIYNVSLGYQECEGKKGSSSTKTEDRASFPDLTQDMCFSVNFSVLICPGIAIKQSCILR